MTDLERRLVASMRESADLLEEWIGETDLPSALEIQGGQAVAAFRVLAGAVQAAGQ